MKENFKGGLNKVMLMNKAPVDSRYHQRGGDNRQVRRTRTSVNNRPIRVWGRFGCLYSPVRDADWSDVLSVGGSPVGKDKWIGYIGDNHLMPRHCPNYEISTRFFISTVIVLQDLI